MKVKHVVSALLALLMVFVTLAAASPAYAISGLTHHVVRLPWNGEELWSAAGEACEFDIYAHNEGTFLVNYWTEESGLPKIEFYVYGGFHRTLTAGGNTVKVEQQGPAHWVYTYLPDNVVIWQVKSIGTYLLITAPGVGRIWGGSGLMEETATIDFTDPDNPIILSYSLIKRVGNWNFAAGGPLCDYLRP